MFVIYKEAHQQWTKLTPGQKHYIREPKQRHVKPGKRRLVLKKKIPELIQSNIKQIYMRFVLNIKKIETVLDQQILLLANNNGYVYYFENDSKHAIAHVFMDHPESVN